MATFPTITCRVFRREIINILLGACKALHHGRLTLPHKLFIIMLNAAWGNNHRHEKTENMKIGCCSMRQPMICSQLQMACDEVA
jgi:hypothetical protein